jgi:hypothetical protein
VRKLLLRLARFSSFSGVLISILLLQAGALPAEQIPVRDAQGTTHGFLVLRSMVGKQLAVGELTQIIRENRVISHLVFHFKDGSIEDETTVFSQRHDFKLLTDRHLQKGPLFAHPMDVAIDASTGQVTVRSLAEGKDKVKTYHLDLPPDLSNGLLLTILTNVRPHSPEIKVSYVATTPKPRIVKFAIDTEGEDTFSVAGVPHKAVRYVVKTEIGGVAGIVAPLIGKQPKDERVWVIEGIAPTFVRMEGPLAEGGPVFQIERTSPVLR